jgi:tetratricopeptide (TPR) repeat protein
MMAVAMAYKGDFAQALMHCQEIVRLGQEGADPQVRCWGLSWGGSIQRRLGQFFEAIAALQEASELAQVTQDYRFCVFADGELGRCYLHKDQLKQALAALEVSRQFQVEHSDISTLWLPYFSGLVEVYLLATEQASKSEKAKWLKAAGHACREALKQGKAYRGVLPEAMRLQGTYEWLKGKPTSAQKWWQRSHMLAEEMGQRYDSGMALWEMGQRLGDRLHLERAEAVFAEIEGLGKDSKVSIAM